ncbi:hypothetical protein VMCG_00901 [Cytospora schulzeri]|uniref:Cystathionine gamma-synthase n=1 Tax=Cytospora schulzeri TaxID=448051 RepID=A0A423X5J5_9PEZI|nr:hypothetical protein VMCG_00901 [Valsa malicola]
MAVKPITTELGHSAPPEGPHTITFHIPGWETGMRFRDGDLTIHSRLRSVYPRLAPFGLVRQLSTAIGQKLGVPENTGVLMFTDPAAFAVHREYALSEHRKEEHRLTEGELAFRVVDIHGTRLYCVTHPTTKTKGVIGVWQNAGIGISSRTAEELLKHVDNSDDDDDDGFRIVEWSGEHLDDVPPPTYLPQCEAHGKLRQRISDLLHRAPIDPENVKVTPDDVYLYQTGMAAIYRLHDVLTRQREPGGTVLVLGSIFHNTFHLFEESAGGMKHFGRCDAGAGVMDEVEEYLDAHYRQGRTVSYAFLEFPSNPILVSAELGRLRGITARHAIPLVVDDTVGSFCNIDVLPVADVLISSCTKSFSGYADVMCGSLVLNPLSPFYPVLKSALAAGFRNEFFSGDAERLLANSEDYLPRSTILNRNAAALASYLSSSAATPSSSSSSSSPIKQVLYPTTSDTRPNYESLMRPATPDFTPGYGCLLSVEFHTVDTARVFYDNLHFHCGPHLGGHRTLAMPFNATLFGADPVQMAYHAAYGAGPEQVRISVGLEDEGEILAAVGEALARAEEFHRTGEEGVGGVGEVVVAVEETPEAVTLLIFLLAPSPATVIEPSISRARTHSANSLGSTGTPAASASFLLTSAYLTTWPPAVISSRSFSTAPFMSSLLLRSAALVPSVRSDMSMRPCESVAAVLSADLMSRSASRTSSRVTSVDRRILACASASRIIDSSCRVVAVMRFSAERTSWPSLRISTYASTNCLAASCVMVGWMLARA